MKENCFSFIASEPKWSERMRSRVGNFRPTGWVLLCRHRVKPTLSIIWFVQLTHVKKYDNMYDNLSQKDTLCLEKQFPLTKSFFWH